MTGRKLKWLLGTALLASVMGLAMVATGALLNRHLQAPDTDIAQYSTKCQTPMGMCYVPAQPIGSACQCPGIPQQGTIVP